MYGAIINDMEDQERLIGLQEWLHTAHDNLAKAEEDSKRAIQKEAEAQREVGSLEQLIGIVQDRISPAPTSAETGQGAPIPVQSAVNGQTESQTKGSQVVNAAAFIRRLIAESRDVGISMGEIRKALEAAGVKTHRNYPYVVASKIVEDGKAVQREGKYFPQGDSMS